MRERSDGIETSELTDSVTWGDILVDFRREVPDLALKIADFRPHSHLKIQIWLNDGRSLIYDYLNKHCRFIFGDWREQT